MQRFWASPRCAGLTVIIVTASVEPTDRAEALALGADGFFQKPVGFQRFLALGDLIKVVVCGHTQV